MQNQQRFNATTSDESADSLIQLDAPVEQKGLLATNSAETQRPPAIHLLSVWMGLKAEILESSVVLSHEAVELQHIHPSQTVNNYGVITVDISAASAKCQL